uniref:Histone H2A.Y n=2 Tax=Tetrahymena thermophila (strain SB210) TaxID=312017 RepID=H2AY_TETTS|nr:RecName: Full=Histone H2A.Y [Tetrahymena thermophila SB210]AAU87547.2 core histone H2A variant [Tetrahymena thermophila]
MSTDQEKIIKQVLDSIAEQQGDSRDDEVYVIEIMSLRFEKFDNRIKQKIERFTSLQMLTINDCLISDLTNFPHVPSLIRLDLVFNKITGDQLQYLRGSRHLQTLMLGANQIEEIEDLKRLGQMRELIQLDLLNNPVVNTNNYRNLVFNLFPSLVILDTLDKNGIDQEKAALDISASRVPDNLFDKSKPVQNVSKQVVKNAKATQNNLFSSTQKVAQVKQIPKIVPAKVSKPSQASVQDNKSNVVQAKVTAAVSVGRKAPASRNGGVPSKAGKGKMNAFSKQSTSQKSGLVFPCGRLRRYLKQACKQFRVSSSCNIYLAGVLEYLAAEVLETAGNIAKNNRLSRINPVHIREAFRNDAELNQFVNGTIIAEGGSTSTNFVLPIINKSKK